MVQAVKNFTKASARSKTMVFGTILVVFGILQQNMDVFKDIIPPKDFGLFVIVVGIVVNVLRLYTNAPLLAKIQEAISEPSEVEEEVRTVSSSEDTATNEPVASNEVETDPPANVEQK